MTWHFTKARVTTQKLGEEVNSCRMRAEQGDATAAYQLAGLYYQGRGVPQSYNDAVNWYREAAEQGNAKGEYGLGYMYYWGLGVQQDYAQAFQWCWKAADNGYAKAQYDLSFMYQKGEGVPKGVPEALIWCRKAADQGYAKAEYVLGLTYFDGKYLPRDYSESVLYLKAADQGYPEAESNLGYMYYQGLGVRQDYAQAAYWYRKAAKHGDEYGQRALRSMQLPFRPFSRITLFIALLGSSFFLFHSGGRIRNREQQRAVLAGLLGLLSIGLDLYAHIQFGTLLALSVVNPFYFVRGLVSGVFMATVVYFVWPRTSKIILPILSIPFIVVHVYAAMHYGLRYLAVCPRAFYSANGWLVGTALALAILRWASREGSEKSPNGNQEMASGAQPLRM